MSGRQRLDYAVSPHAAADIREALVILQHCILAEMTDRCCHFSILQGAANILDASIPSDIVHSEQVRICISVHIECQTQRHIKGSNLDCSAVCSNSLQTEADDIPCRRQAERAVRSLIVDQLLGCCNRCLQTCQPDADLIGLGLPCCGLLYNALQRIRSEFHCSITPRQPQCIAARQSLNACREHNRLCTFSQLDRNGSVCSSRNILLLQCPHSLYRWC
ncbi:hypothetical protein D3C80_1226500 [compost metagenome]